VVATWIGLCTLALCQCPPLYILTSVCFYTWEFGKSNTTTILVEVKIIFFVTWPHPQYNTIFLSFVLTLLQSSHIYAQCTFQLKSHNSDSARLSYSWPETLFIRSSKILTTLLLRHYLVNGLGSKGCHLVCTCSKVAVVWMGITLGSLSTIQQNWEQKEKNMDWEPKSFGYAKSLLC